MIYQFIYKMADHDSSKRNQLHTYTTHVVIKPTELPVSKHSRRNSVMSSGKVGA